MSGGGGSSQNTTKTIAEPPAETRPYLAPYLSRASELANAPYNEYAGQQVAGLNADQTQAFDMVRQRATDGSPVTANANWNAANTLGGQYLDPASNPWLSKTYNAAASDMARNFSNSVVPGINSSFSLNGRYGSNAHREAFGDAARTLNSGLTNLGTQIYGQNYANERGNQLNVLGMSPQLANADYADAQALIGAGDAQRAFQQENLTSDYNKWLLAQQAPYQNLDVLGNAISTTLGSGGTTTAYGRGANGSNAGQYAGAAIAGLGLLA